MKTYYDVFSLLKKELGDLVIGSSVGLGNESGCDYSSLIINQKYERSIDKVIPISLHIELKDLKDQKANEYTVKQIVSLLKDNGFTTPYLTTSFIDERHSYNYVPEIHNLKY